MTLKTNKKSGLPKIGKDTEIIELREYDGGDFYGVSEYYCVGHYDKQSFAIAVNKTFEDVCIHSGNVKHGYGRKTYKDEDDNLLEEGQYLLEHCPQKDWKSFPITFVEK